MLRNRYEKFRHKNPLAHHPPAYCEQGELRDIGLYKHVYYSIQSSRYAFFIRGRKNKPTKVIPPKIIVPPNKA